MGGDLGGAAGGLGPRIRPRRQGDGQIAAGDAAGGVDLHPVVPRAQGQDRRGGVRGREREAEAQSLGARAAAGLGGWGEHEAALGPPLGQGRGHQRAPGLPAADRGEAPPRGAQPDLGLGAGQGLGPDLGCPPQVDQGLGGLGGIVAALNGGEVEVALPGEVVGAGFGLGIFEQRGLPRGALSGGPPLRGLAALEAGLQIGEHRRQGAFAGAPGLSGGGPQREERRDSGQPSAQRRAAWGHRAPGRAAALGSGSGSA